VKKIILKYKISFLLVVATGLIISSNVCEAESGREMRIKAGFLYNFSKYIAWPEESFKDSGSPLVFCITDHNEFVGVVEMSIKGKKTKGRGILAYGKKGADDLSNCHLVYIGAPDPEKVSKISESLSNASVLTVSHIKDASDLKIIINFVKKKNKFKFKINNDAAENASLKVGSTLLKLGVK